MWMYVAARVDPVQDRRQRLNEPACRMDSGSRGRVAAADRASHDG